ncbi:MAG: hypothetical protein GX577_14295 [Leptolinea sp.]|nr:hypothetical protein [Leptolinea sp.]
MRKKRFFFFLLAAIVGALVGIGFGWYLRPQMYSQAGLSNLRVDYRTDYVLMTAEIFHHEQNVEEARRRLQALGNDLPDRYASEALLSAGQMGYTPTDLQYLADLVQAVAPVVNVTITPGVVSP